MSIPFKVSNQTEYTRREEVCNPEINCTHPKLVLHSANSEISLKIKKKQTHIHTFAIPRGTVLDILRSFNLHSLQTQHTHTIVVYVHM